MSVQRMTDERKNMNEEGRKEKRKQRKKKGREGGRESVGEGEDKRKRKKEKLLHFYSWTKLENQMTFSRLDSEPRKLQLW